MWALFRIAAKPKSEFAFAVLKTLVVHTKLITPFWLTPLHPLCVWDIFYEGLDKCSLYTINQPVINSHEPGCIGKQCRSRLKNQKSNNNEGNILARYKDTIWAKSPPPPKKIELNVQYVYKTIKINTKSIVDRKVPK